MLRPIFSRIFGHMRRHSWTYTVLGIGFTTALGGAGVWIRGVNATAETVTKHEAILPRIETQLARVIDKQDETNQRLSNIEGRLAVKK